MVPVGETVNVVVKTAEDDWVAEEEGHLEPEKDTALLALRSGDGDAEVVCDNVGETLEQTVPVFVTEAVLLTDLLIVPVALTEVLPDPVLLCVPVALTVTLPEPVLLCVLVTHTDQVPVYDTVPVKRVEPVCDEEGQAVLLEETVARLAGGDAEAERERVVQAVLVAVRQPEALVDVVMVGAADAVLQLVLVEQGEPEVEVEWEPLLLPLPLLQLVVERDIEADAEAEGERETVRDPDPVAEAHPDNDLDAEEDPVAFRVGIMLEFVPPDVLLVEGVPEFVAEYEDKGSVCEELAEDVRVGAGPLAVAH